MHRFLQSLRGSGEVVVTADPAPPLGGETASALREHDALFRSELPAAPPALDVAAAYWGAKKLYEACQLLVRRDAPEGVARETLAEACVLELTPPVDYAVDLTFQYLPSLFRLAERVAPEDPLLDAMVLLGSDWPLSSVGMPGVACDGREIRFLEHPCLRRLYVDRIMETKDFSRITNERMKAHVRAALGAYPELEPELARHCDPS